MEFPIVGLDKKTKTIVDLYDVVKDEAEAEVTKDLLNKDKDENNLIWEVRKNRTTRKEVTEHLSH